MKFIFLIVFLSTSLFAETVISPNMNLPVPVVGSTPGPEWANDINSCMSSIDEHDHTPGKGVPISSSALSINADLPLNDNSLTSTKSVVFSSQPSFSTVQSLYVENPDLFYNDGNGNVIRITQSGAVSGASGTITGLPSGTASASYQSVGGTFQFQSATNTPANGTFASLSIAEQTATPNSITLKSPTSLAASYNVTFPGSVPAYTSLLTMGTSGTLVTVPYHVPTVQKFTSGSGTYTLPSNPAPYYIQIEMVGAGGGGGAAGAGAIAGSAGTDTTFGANTAGGGFGGAQGAATGGSGGIGSLGLGSGYALTGGYGGPGVSAVGGGLGGSSALGGAGGGLGSAGIANSGSGGAGNSAVGSSGQGGGAGAYIKAIVTSPASTYSYGIGVGGVGGTGANTGGDGGSGLVVITEYYQ